MQILIVDDDNLTLNILSEIISQIGHTAIMARNGQEALERLHQGDIHLVITDWDMPGMDGVELCRAIRREDLPGYVYVIMLTAREGGDAHMQALAAGADDFLSKPVNASQLIVRFKTAERILALETRDVALFAMAKLAESRDPETGAHLDRVQNYTRLIARQLSENVKKSHQVDEQYIHLLYQTSPLHDIGKVGIPDRVLLKPGQLTAAEYEVMKTHTILGSETLEAALQRFPQARFLQMARDIAATHHEKFDGSGYPRGLSGEQIPLCGRIVALADVYDALTSRRIYKDAMSHQQAKSIILRERGGHFDPDVVDAFLRAENKIIEVCERFRDERQPAAMRINPGIAPAEEMHLTQSPARVLVVEDSAMTRNRIVQLLSKTGATIYAASNSTDAMKLFTEHLPHVIVSDLEMPGDDGMEFCRQVRQHPSLANTYFIMLTVHSKQTALLESYKAGVNDFVGKPFNPKELLARVNAGIHMIRLQEELEQKTNDLRAMNVNLATMNSRLDRLSITDELTGLFNRRHAMLRLEEQVAMADRYDRPLAVAIIDIDHFKQVNDSYGHDVGDVVLRNVAGIIRDQMRGTDVVCRVGGEEFLILFPSQTMEEAEICVERCRIAVAQHKHRVHDGELTVTISIGLGARTSTVTQLPDILKSADDALYAAKDAGRNCVRKFAKNEGVSPMTANEVPNATAPAKNTSSIDMDLVRERCGGDPEFASAVVERFRTEANSEVDRISESKIKEDVDTVRRSAHNLKSMAAYVSADEVSELSGQIEMCARSNDLSDVEQLTEKLRDEVQRVIEWIEQNTRASVLAS